MNRYRDWWTQAQADLRHAQHALEDGDYEKEAEDAIRYSEEILRFCDHLFRE
jgi:HEPN domain-containing protein